MADVWDESDDELLAAADPQFSAALDDALTRQQLLDDLVSRRRGAGLTQAGVAAHMETTQSFVSDLENRKTDPHLSTFQRYARAVGAQLAVRVEAAPSIERRADTLPSDAARATSRAAS